ncbi:hypothetical protein ADIAG_03168 [Paeniglutamicibacter gangotriensis Lz1y]|uniref:Uncharacterized protein n=1 Tax=Paeniglutamicibacter gangotriensis Lz1y TaxID=1276920 RepID=M7NFV0_9MICC|nr:hypothetical protein ADIAG_03168 [Paeniglutamicibacter gangotriensis Lz1y]
MLTGGKSNRAILDLALRRLIASKQNGTMIEGISASSDLESEIGSTVVAPPHTVTDDPGGNSVSVLRASGAACIPARLRHSERGPSDLFATRPPQVLEFRHSTRNADEDTAWSMFAPPQWG